MNVRDWIDIVISVCMLLLISLTGTILLIKLIGKDQPAVYKIEKQDRSHLDHISEWIEGGSYE